MVSNRPTEPTLMGIPKKIREKIMEKLFEDETMEVEGGYRNETANWPVAVLYTCHLLCEEAKQAIRKQVMRCGLDYLEGLSSEEDDLESDDDPIDWSETAFEDEAKSFLLQYGDCIERLSSLFVELEGGFSLNWFLSLKVFELHGECYKIVATDEDKPLVNGKLDKAIVLEIFKHWYRNPKETRCLLSPELINLIKSTKAVDRSFDIHVHVGLTIRDVSYWVSQTYLQTSTAS